MRTFRLSVAVVFLLVGLWLVVYNGLGYETTGYGQRATLVYREPARSGLTTGVVLLAAAALLYPRRRVSP